MRTLALSLALVASTAAAIVTVACSSPSGSGAACTAYVVPQGTDLTTPTMSFQNDILPIFEQSCGLSDSCHGAPGGPRIFLGSKKVASTTPQMVHDNIVEVMASDLPTMNYVTPSDTANSFLMHKMDGDECTLNAKCTSGDCGVSMPQDNDILEVATRDKVRRWIAQGALNN
jgi:hypothetical protein